VECEAVSTEGTSTLLPADSVFRWEVACKNPLLSRQILARLFPQSIDSPELFREIAEEDKRTRPIVVAIGVMARYLVVTILRVSLTILALFCAMWGIAATLGHPRFMSFAGYGFAGVYTFLAIYQALKYLASSSTVTRQRIAFRIKALGFLAIPMLMYATACPTTTSYVPPASAAVPSFWDWLAFFGYMFSDVVAFGVPQALFGEISSFQPPSLSAAANTLWIKSLMTIAVAGVIVSSVARNIASRHTFVGTMTELHEWLKMEFPGRDTDFVVRPLAVDQPFGSTDQHALPVEVIRDHREMYGAWGVTLSGQFSHPLAHELADPKGVREAEKVMMQFVSVFGHAKVKDASRAFWREVRAQMLNALWTLAVAMASSLLLMFALVPLGQMQLTEAVAVSLAVGILLFALATSLQSRYEQRAYFDFVRHYVRALQGESAKIHKRLRGLVTRIYEFNRAVAFPFRNGRRALLFDELLDKELRANEASQLFSLVAFEGRKDVWILHGHPLASQGVLSKILYDRSTRVLVGVASDGSHEILDLIIVNDEFQAKLLGCETAFMMLCPSGSLPCLPQHVQKVPLECVEQCVEATSSDTTRLSRRAEVHSFK